MIMSHIMKMNMCPAAGSFIRPITRPIFSNMAAQWTTAGTGMMKVSNGYTCPTKNELSCSASSRAYICYLLPVQVHGKADCL